LNLHSAATVKLPASFWTCGANEGDICDVEQIYSWCAEGTRVKRQEISLPWADGNSPGASERCLSLHLNSTNFALDYAECNATKYAVCEVKSRINLMFIQMLKNDILAFVQQPYLSCYLQCKRIII
jgi:hypothetical protein